MLTTAAAAKLLQLCPTLCNPRDGSPPGFPVPGILQGKNSGVGCHFLLQCMKGKSESEVTESCPTLSDPMDCSSPGSSVHGIFQARVLDGDILLMITNWMINSYAFEICYVLSTILGTTEDIIRMHKILDQENLKSSSAGHSQTQTHKDTYGNRHTQTFTEIHRNTHANRCV